MDSDLRESEFMMLQDCPDAETLRRYLAGDEKISDFKALDNHIAKCSLCHNQLQQLALESDIMTKLVAESDKSPVSELPLDLQRALETIRKSSAEDRSSQSNSAESEFEHVMIRDYRVLELIGEGGMGSVYRAIHLKMNRPVAIKVLKCDRANASEAIARFTREMHLIAQLDHPNIVKALDAGEQEGLHYLVMEYIAGLNVNQLYRRLGPLPIPEACQIIQLATAGLRYAHERKIIHRDIKPSNFMVGSDGICKLLDLGLAQCFDLSNPNSVSRANQAVGTLAYMAPEQLSGVRQITAQCDVFSLGVSLHEILTGQRPMPQHGKTPWFADVQSIRPDVDTALSQFVKKMVSASPSDRPTPQEVENLMAEYADPANLASLVAEYYRWNRGRNSDPHSGSQSSPANHPTESMHAVQTLQSETNWLGNANQSIRVLTVIPRKARFNTMRAILRVAATLLVISLGTIAAWFFFSPNTDQPPPPPLMLTGELDIGPIGDVSKKLLEGGKVYAYSINKESEEVRLVEGVNQLPLGNYSIRIINGPEFFDDVNDIKIAKGPPLKQKLNPVLSKPFQFPSIPSRPGDFGNYHGTIKHADWDKGLGVEVTFNLHLEILSIEMSGDKLFKWLKIEIRANHASGESTIDRINAVTSGRKTTEPIDSTNGNARNSPNPSSMTSAEIRRNS